MESLTIANMWTYVTINLTSLGPLCFASKNFALRANVTATMNMSAILYKGVKSVYFPPPIFLEGSIGIDDQSKFINEMVIWMPDRARVSLTISDYDPDMRYLGTPLLMMVGVSDSFWAVFDKHSCLDNCDFEGNNILHLLMFSLMRQLHPSDLYIRVDVLIRAGIQINTRNNGGTSAFHYLLGCANSDLKRSLVRLFIINGADLYAVSGAPNNIFCATTGIEERGPLSIALERGEIDIAKLILAGRRIKSFLVSL